MDGILTQYHFICDTYVGLDMCTIRRIPCAFVEWKNAMDIPCDAYLEPIYHQRSSSITKFKYYSTLGKHNDWVIMSFTEKGKYEE